MVCPSQALINAYMAFIPLTLLVDEISEPCTDRQRNYLIYANHTRQSVGMSPPGHL